MQWVVPDVREQVIVFFNLYKHKTSLPVNWFIGKLGISSSKYYFWIGRRGKLNKHNGSLPRNHWIVSWERDAINQYAKDHLGEGYRRLTYMMIDEKILLQLVLLPLTECLRRLGCLKGLTKLRRQLKDLGLINQLLSISIGIMILCM